MCISYLERYEVYFMGVVKLMSFFIPWDQRLKSVRFIPLYSSNDCCQIVSYQAVPATFSQIRLPEDLLLLQQVSENLVEHFFMLNTPTRVISKRNFRVPSVKILYDIDYII